MDDDGLIEIYSPIELHNMRYNLAGTSYKTSTAFVGNSAGCKGDEVEEDARVCFGYELMENLDFDGDKDGRTWSGSGDEGFRLDRGDSQADYFPVDEDGAGGWLPIGDEANPFAATFDGNGRTISNLAIRRDQTYVGLFGFTSGAVIRNIGLIDNLADYSGSSNDGIYIGGLAGYQDGGSIRASYATGAAACGDGSNNNRVGGLVGLQNSGLVTESYATGAAYCGDGESNFVGGLVGQHIGGSITASYATGPVAGGDGGAVYVGGLVGFHHSASSITASYATGPVAGGDGINAGYVGGLVGFHDFSSITASYATGVVNGGDGTDYIGGLVGFHKGGSITASYATGAVDGGGGGHGDIIGGLVGFINGASITASYATGAASGSGSVSFAGALVGRQRMVLPGNPANIIIDSYGFGDTLNAANYGPDGSPESQDIGAASELKIDNAGSSWNAVGNNTLNAWDFGTDTQFPALNYANYDGDGDTFDCDPASSHFPAAAATECNDGDDDFTLLPGQADVSAASNPSVVEFGEIVSLTGSLKFGRVTIESWRWRQLAGPDVIMLSDANTSAPTFTAPLTKEPLVFELTAEASDGLEYSDRISIDSVADRDGNGLIEIHSLIELHNMRHNLTGTSYKASATSAGNSLGCPEDGGCKGYELMQHLDFDVDEDGRTWSGNGDDGYTLDSDDHRADYFPVDEDGAGGWLPIGNQTNLFAAVFDGNGRSIRNLAISRSETFFVGLFGAIGSNAAIRNLGLIDNLAEYTGSSDEATYIGGLVGLHRGGSITASYATGPADGGDGDFDYVGGLVGAQVVGSITASYATGPAAGGSGEFDIVGGLVGNQNQRGGSIMASYATGPAAGGDGDFDFVGGLVGQQYGSITASYATGPAAGGEGDNDSVGALVGFQSSDGPITESYGFGVPDGEVTAEVGLHPTLTSAAQLTAPGSDADTAAGTSWNAAESNTLGAWDFGGETQIPALNYADYDGDGDVFACTDFPTGACPPPTLLPGQDEVSVDLASSALEPGETVMLAGSLEFGRIRNPSWSWRQLAGPTVTLSVDNARETTFTAPLSKEPMLFELTATGGDGHRRRARISLSLDVDRNDNGLIEIDSLLDLHNMRHNLAGTSYRASSSTPLASVGNSFGCPDTGCFGYELMRDLDFDGDDDDGGTWSGNGDDGYTLDSHDHQADYFPVDEDGAGGWLPIGDGNNPFAAVFDGNGRSIRNLAIRRDQTHVGLFGAIGDKAAIRNLGLIDNLADYTGSSVGPTHIGGLAGLQLSASITASYATGAATGAADGGDISRYYVGGLVGYMDGSITASYATGAADGGDGDSDRAGGLVGYMVDGSITASYATGAAAGGDGDFDYVGGLVGWQAGGSITASYATGAVGGGGGNFDYAGGLVGRQGGSITASYGFGEATGELEGPAGPAKPEGVETAAQLTVDNVDPSWNDASKNTWGAWDFGDGTQIPALNYADYDGIDGEVFACADFPAAACGTLLPGQRYAVVVSVARLEVDEGGSASYSLRLASAPTGRVWVRVVVPSAYQDSLRASPARLFFDDVAEGQAEHWRTDQRVTLSLEEDGLSSGTRVVTVEHRVSSTDPSYQGLEVPSVEVALIDNDPLPSLRLVLDLATAVEGSGSDPGGETSEDVVTVMVTAKLNGARRSTKTVVALTVGGVDSDTAGGEDYQTNLLPGATLIIPAKARKSEPLELVVTLFQDRIIEGDESFTIRASADVLGAASATFVIVDDDRAGVEVTLKPRNVRAGDEIEYTVFLTSEPAFDVGVAVVVIPALDSGVGLDDVTATLAPLIFTPTDYGPKRLTLNVKEEVAGFGELDIVHVLTSMDANYDGRRVGAIRLELVEVDTTLQSLELRLEAAGELLPLRNIDGRKIDFSADIDRYFATVPFPAASAFITATPAVAADILMNGEVVQRRAEVRIFRAEQDKGEDVAGKETSVDLPGNEDRFAFHIEVSVQPSVDGGEVAMESYSLTLTRALPADAELRVYRAADGERETPITEDLNFGADDDDMDLILILSRGGNISYNISEIAISGSDDRFEEAVGIQIELEGGGFETPVTLRRVDDNATPDVRYSLTFTATPERSPDDAADANQLSATIAGTLKANTDTETEFREVTYRSHSQGEKRPITSTENIRVSANGPVTITLNVRYSGGGERAVEPSDFIFSFVGGVAGSIQDNILEIQPGRGGQVTVAAAAASSLGERINLPDALVFTLSFESPRALIRAAADPNPLLAFREPFLAFVGEDNKLPLEVVLAADSIPLAGSDDILGKLQLTVTLAVAGGDIPATVAIAGAAADDGLPGRDLAFAVKAPKNNVTVTVAVVSGREDELVDVAGLSFRAHFLSLESRDEIEFRGDAEVFGITLSGEDPANDSWTFEIINSAEFEGHGYRVEEVALTGTELIYEASTAESDVETRHLRVTGDATAVNSRVVLEFKYLLDGGAAAVFTRTIRLTSGREADLEVAVIPGTLVLPQGGSGQVRILISNLAPDQDPTGFIVVRPDHAELAVELQGSGTIDRSNRRFEQRLKVRAAADAERPEYTVRVEVRLPGKDAVGTEFKVYINDAPQYEGKTALTVYESGPGRVLEFPLSIVDSDGGTQFLDATELYMKVIGFDDSFNVASNAGHENRYFDLAFSGISAVGQEEGPPNGKPNSLALTLTLSGKLATPFNSVVELLLFGVTDGFNGFEQRLTVGVKNRPPQFELAQTQGVKVFLEREPTAIPLRGLEEGAKVLVLQAPADLVVKFDETNGQVTLRRLDTDVDEDRLTDIVKLAALDAQGGRTPVTIEIQRPPRLPRMVPPPPLLIAAGQSGTLQLQLAADTGLNVTWTIAVADSDDLDDFIEEDYGLTKVAGGHAELRLTLAASVAAGVEFDLWVTAYVGEEAGGYRRTARLPVLVVAETAKPHLKLRATVSDQSGAAMVVSSFALGESLSIDVELEGEVPSTYKGDDATAPPSFQISIFKLDASGVAVVDPIMDVAESKVVDGELKIDSVVFGEERIAELSLSEGDAVRVSVGLPPDSTGVSDEIIASASLVLRVSEKAVKDVDNDGLADDTGEDTVPEILGPIAAAVAGVTASGVASAGTGIAVSLSLGETSRLLGLGECGGVSLTLTLTLSEDGAAASLSGCSGAAIDAGPLFAAETLVALGIEEDEEYRLFDLSATFDSSEAGGGGFLVISLPLDPQQPYVVYRFDRDANEWVPVAAAGLPGQAGLGGGGALADFESDCGSCFYAFDLDRDGAVQLLLLLVPMDAAAGSEFALDDAALEGRHIEIGADKTETITLVGLEGLTVEIRGAAIDGGNVTGTVSTDDGTVELIGLRRTANGPQEVLIEALDGGQVVAAISLYVRVPNQPPEVSFFIQPSGEELKLTTTIALAANSETVLTVIVEDLARRRPKLRP